MASSNLVRHYSFLLSTIETAIALGDPWLFKDLIKREAGQYRSIDVTVGSYRTPPPEHVPRLMAELMNELERDWGTHSPAELAAHALWRINNIHPFVNGNGRTARAICYFILCVKLGGLLPGRTLLPERLRADPDWSQHYTPALQEADKGNLEPLKNLIGSLLNQQIT